MHRELAKTILLFSQGVEKSNRPEDRKLVNDYLAALAPLLAHAVIGDDILKEIGAIERLFGNTWVIDNSWLFPDIEVKVVNRWGQVVFYSKGYGNGIEWDGTNNGKELPIGTYYYVIILNDGGNTPPMTGPVTIIR